MKKLWLIGGLLCCMSIWARTPEQAACVASEFLSSKNTPAVRRMQQAEKAKAVTAPVEIAYTQMQVDNEPAVYVFNGEDGFVLVSAEDDARAILGYSDHGRFDATDMPKNMQFWLQMYANEIARKQANKPILKTGQTSLPRIRRADAEYPTIAPILEGVEWDQGRPFNLLCPMMDGQWTVTGCVATALSQIMYAHKYPQRGSGSCSYEMSNGQTVSATFDVDYDWDNMLPSYTGTYSPAESHAVAKLMYHVGVASHMDYGIEASGTLSNTAMIGLSTYFGYDADIVPMLKNYMREKDLLTAISTELQTGRPVYMDGVTKNKEGHAFVCDGMQSDGYLHINWGWGGYSNGYFALSALDPEDQGIGGSSGNLAFTEQVTAFVGIRPDEGGKAKPVFAVDELTRTCADTIGRYDRIPFKLEMLINYGLETANGTLGYYFYNEDSTLVYFFGVESIDDVQMWQGYEYINFNKALPTDIDGELTMEIAFKDAEGEIHPLWVKNQGRVRIPVNVDNYNYRITFGDIVAPEEESYAAITGIDVTNVNLTKTWQVDLYSTFFWSDYESDNEVLIRLTLNSGSETSVIGSYVMDPTNSGAVGTIDASGLYATGYYQACYQYVPTDAHLTITPDENGALQVEYYIQVNGKSMSDVITIVAPEWYMHDTEEDRYYFFSDYITYELASTLSASRAREVAQASNNTGKTKLAYFVSGIVSNIHNTPEDIAQNKVACFDISDDGASHDQLYCENVKWLSNSNFTNGNEIALGDEVVIFGSMQCSEGSIPTINGHVYSHNGQTSAGIEDIILENGSAIFDIMGRRVSTNNLTTGVYVLRTGDKTKKIYINKQ